MTTRVWAARLGSAALTLWVGAGAASAEESTAALDRAERAIGVVTSIRYSGVGTQGAVGMNWTPAGPWHVTRLQSYTRTIDYPTASSREDLTRTQEDPPVLGGEAPFVEPIVEGLEVCGPYAWNQPVDAWPRPAPDMVRPAPASAEARGLRIWLTPHGFLQAARAHHALAAPAPKDDPKATRLTFKLGAYTLSGLIDGDGRVRRIDTAIPNPVLGDMPLEVTFSDYRRFGGMLFPTRILETQGGSTTFDLKVAQAEADVAGAALSVPEAVRSAKIPPETVKSEKIADGVWMLQGGHNSVLVEFRDYLVVVEAPVDEARSLAVIAEVKRLVPGKPIAYVLNTHHHFDHSGGLRTFVAEGAAVVTQEANKPFYEWAWRQPRTLEPDALAKAPRPATIITFKNKYRLTDGDRTIEMYLDFGDMHDKYLSFAYLPKERILIEADDFSAWYITSYSLAMWNNLYGNLQRLQLDPLIIAPLHGPAARMDVWLKTLRDNADR